MTWIEEVRRLVETMPRDFGLDDLRPYYGGFKMAHPANLKVEEKIRQVLQNLAVSGEVEELEPDCYRRTGRSPLRVWPLSPGDETTRAELAEILGMDGIQGLGRGMFKLRAGPHNQDLLLFQQAEGPYDDKPGDDYRVIYVGMGQKQHGDQKWEGMNRYLGEHLQRGIIPHLFRQVQAKSPTLEYVGEVVCEDVGPKYLEHEGRVVFEYELAPVRNSKSVAAAFSKTMVHMMEAPNLEARVETRSRVVSRVERYARDQAFATVVRQEYQDQCAVCGAPLARGVHQDLQGAHVRPVAAGGPDEINNGICLCARHHWAYDRGVFALNDQFEIQVHPKAKEDPHEELIVGREIHTPSELAYRPHPDYLAYHRATYGFAAPLTR